MSATGLLWTSMGAPECLETAKTFLYAQETENCLILSTIQAVLAGRLSSEEVEVFILRQHGKTLVQGVAIRVRQELILTQMPRYAAATLAGELAAIGQTLEEIIGPRQIVEDVLDWSSKHDLECYYTMRQGVYELVANELSLPSENEGRLQKATAAQAEVVARYLSGFRKECFPDEEDSVEQVHGYTARLIEKNRVYLWVNEEGAFVSMAAMVRQTKNAGSISLVYTAPEHRGNGYGSQAVGHLSRVIFEQGKRFCNLFTDLSNRQSNMLYERLGYVMCAEHMVVRIRPKA